MILWQNEVKITGRRERGHQHYQMVKHWNIYNGGQGSPEFNFHIVKVSRTASERQVAGFKDTLNSKSRFTRSGISRLTLKKSHKETVTKKNPNHLLARRTTRGKDGEHIIKKHRLREKRAGREEKKQEKAKKTQA